MPVLTTTLVAGFVGTLLADVAKNVLGNRADAGVEAAWKAVKDHFSEKARLQNHDLDRAVARSFLMAQFSICQDCLQEVTLRQQLEWREVGWVEYRALRLKAMVKDLKKAQPEVPFDDTSAAALLVDPDAPIGQVKALNDQLVVAAIGESAPPEVYEAELRAKLYQRMSAYFQVELKYNDVVRYIFEAQLLASMRREAKEHGLQLERVEQHLGTLADQLAHLREINEAILAEVRDLRGDLDERLNLIVELQLQVVESRKAQVCEVRVFDLGGRPLTTCFTGRQAVLDQLHGGLRESVQVLTGMGGVGKSQVAVAYCHKYRQEYRVIFWVPAEKPEVVTTAFARLAVKLGLETEPVMDQPRAVASAVAWLEQENDWLLVFDNAECEDVVFRHLPDGFRGHVLVTSRLGQWSAAVRQVPLGTWSEPEAESFLQARLGKVDPRGGEVARTLGCLPLALEHAAAFILTSGMSMDGYLELYRRRRRKLLEKSAHRDLPAVYTTWDVSFAAAEKESRAATALLQVCAFLAPDGIPLELFRRGAAALPDPLATAAAEELDLVEAVEVLHRYSLITPAEGVLSVHRLIQAVTQDRLKAEDRNRWTEVAVAVVAESIDFEPDKLGTWSWMARLLPQALAVSEYGGKRSSTVLNATGQYLSLRAEYDSARKAFERALAIDEKVYGPDHPRVASLVNNLGLVLQDLGDLAGAWAHVERALAIEEKVYGPDHPRVARLVNNLGLVLQDLGDLAGARAQLERALAIDEKVYGPDHPEVATDRNNLGGVLKDLGDLAGAWAQFERALAIDEKVYGPDHPTVAIRVNNLGIVLQDLGDLAGAWAQYERALAIDERVYGPDHPTVATDRNNLGSVLKALGDLAGARVQFERAVAIDEGVYGPDHPNVATDRNNLGSVLQGLGDLAGARAQYERALAIAEKVYGPDHPDVVTKRNNLGGVLQDLGDLARARAQFERALAIAEKVYGPDHPTVATVRGNLKSVTRGLLSE